VSYRDAPSRRSWSNTVFYLLGGEGDHGPVATVESVELTDGSVRNLGYLPTPRRALAALEIEGLIFALGGTAVNDPENGARQSLVEVFDVAAKKWMFAPTMPYPKEVPAVREGRYIYALGGYNGAGKAEKTCARYDLTTAKWERLPDTPFPSSGYAVAEIGGAIVCFGDYDEQDQVTAYLPGQQRWVRLQIAFRPRRHATACVANDTVYVIGGNHSGDGSGGSLRVIDRFRVADLKAAIVRALPQK
jgi:hypothetical protein